MASTIRTMETEKADMEAGDSVLKVVTGIQRLIEHGKLAPGQRLLAANLMSRFCVSRPAVREAIRFLAGEGIVELVQNRGGRVAIFGPERLANMLAVFSAIFRAAVETLVATPLDGAKKHRLNQALDGVIRAARYGSEFDRLQEKFNYYYTISQICGNDFIREALDRLHIRHYIRQEGFEGFLPSDIDIETLYTELHERLLARDAAGVYEILKPSLDRLADHLRRYRP